MIGAVWMALTWCTAFANLAAATCYFAAYERGHRARHGWSCAAFCLNALGWLALCLLVRPQ